MTGLGRYVTGKTIILVTLTLAIVASILSIFWDISARFMLKPDVVPAPIVETVEPKKAVKANAGSENGKAVSSAPNNKTDQDAKLNQGATIETGAYDDSWTGTAPADEVPAAKTEITPEPVSPAAPAKNTIADPYAPDDREDSAASSTTAPTVQNGQAPDPYSGDDRETN